MSADQFAAYGRMAESIKERFGDNWQIVYDAEYDTEVSVRTEDSTATFYTEMFATSQTSTDDPLEVAGFLAGAIDMVPALLTEVDRLRGRIGNALRIAREMDPTLGADLASEYDRRILAELLGTRPDENAP